MDDLLPYFQRELVILRRDSREFAERFPTCTARAVLLMREAADNIVALAAQGDAA